jgi:hypothetical protein
VGSRAWTLSIAFALAGCALDRSGLMGAAPDAAPPGDDGSATVDAGTSPDGGGQPGDAGGGADAAGSPDAAGGNPDASSSMDASSDGADESTGSNDGGTNDGPATGYPTSCAQAGADSGTQDVTLYVGGDPSKPWTAHCSGGKEYLPLGTAGSNFSSYPSGGCAAKANGPISVTTTWTMLRIDPVMLVVDTSDYTGATSTGDTKETSGNGTVNTNYTEMPYASGRSCVDQNPSAATAAIDLSSTPFAVDTSQAWYLPGYSNNNMNNTPFGGASPASGKTLSLLVGGFPGGITPCQTDYYQTKGGACLQLVYSP